MTDLGITFIRALELPEDRIAKSIEDFWQQRVYDKYFPPLLESRLLRRISPDARFGLVDIVLWDGGVRSDPLTYPSFKRIDPVTTAYGGYYEVAAEYHSAAGDSGSGEGVVFVNAFELPINRIDEFLPHWNGRAELQSHAPGFRNSRMHRAIHWDTHFQLINISHWDSVEAWQFATANPDLQQRRAASPDFVTPNGALFRVVAES
ncbi:antibiotic biosynthesis monooxygenase family protein [Nocardia concava]|uniref:antibiotic biosynthesis monooxygenase family protein n=1 Tax=Nocardia concava TaxID=257281 RepID=UPI0002FB464F|nr:antibiotic biosynthesis monooxygenase [Nocardia concava]